MRQSSVKVAGDTKQWTLGNNQAKVGAYTIAKFYDAILEFGIAKPVILRPC